MPIAATASDAINRISILRIFTWSPHRRYMSGDAFEFAVQVIYLPGFQAGAEVRLG